MFLHQIFFLDKFIINVIKKLMTFFSYERFGPSQLITTYSLFVSVNAFVRRYMQANQLPQLGLKWLMYCH